MKSDKISDGRVLQVIIVVLLFVGIMTAMVNFRIKIQVIGGEQDVIGIEMSVGSSK